ncbi:uncharacterized protein LOC116295232 isoform X3 [Actinia tenebrosa]|uniref:Uncharacterized protein LOC116295232 isoform X3 n=1 Tax=Actinia tenebrosa TaxID=6105 RepID=A0A6P8HR63_ACTTE|nr:uncharacterized protein LOC116295232 isoform X3 [Actinia tenebrosa]
MLNKTVFLLVLWIGFSIEDADGACDLKFIKIGCFKDDQIEPRPLPELLFNDRDGSSGQEIDWKNWDKYVDDITCRCAKAAAKNRFGYFALQFYGECWSGQDAGASFPRAGRSSHCVSKGFEKCAERSRKNCVGESLSNFVYMMLAHESLCHVKYEKVGCYNNNRAFPILLFTDSNSNSPKYSNVSLDLSHWNSYIMDLTCRCAAKTKEHNYKYFSLQNFGECWSSSELETSAPMSEDQDTCIGKNFQKCDHEDVVCVGRGKSNYVFNIV